MESGGGGEPHFQLLADFHDLGPSLILAKEPSLAKALELLVLLVHVLVLLLMARMVVVLEGLGTSGGGIVAPVDLCLGRFGGMVLLVQSLVSPRCSQRFELNATCLSVLILMDVLVSLSFLERQCLCQLELLWLLLPQQGPWLLKLLHLKNSKNC